MKKSAIAVLLLLLTGSSIFFNASAASGTEIEYYSDGSYTTLIGLRGTLDCNFFWGQISRYRIIYPCL